MSGQHVGQRASELLDGRLTAAAELEVRAHLGRCAQCAAIVHREQQVRGTLRAAACQAPLPRGDLMAGLMALAASPPPAPPAPAAHRSPNRPSVLAAAVLGSVSLASAGAIGVGVVAGGALAGGAVSPVRQPSSLSSPGFASTTSVVQPAVAVLRGAVTTSSLTGIRVVDVDAASRP